MNRFSLSLNIGENATVLAYFDLEDDGFGSYGINWETLQVMYKGIDIIDTLDQHDLASLDRQVRSSWDEIEQQIYEQNDVW